ncbi:hypothetical protein ARMGADRAFT_1028486 [Armillaria gallica]|uniref:Uncharacterized protein n=1 Tax=Armillaria gallica TaxID=47427 RepID=A0A2H3E5W6_ARMGA|nr:hypothetical protein ARMGADRAFT_1028486 [Armillaria gallica]
MNTVNPPKVSARYIEQSLIIYKDESFTSQNLVEQDTVEKSYKIQKITICENLRPLLFRYKNEGTQKPGAESYPRVKSWSGELFATDPRLTGPVGYQNEAWEVNVLLFFSTSLRLYMVALTGIGIHGRRENRVGRYDSTESYHCGRHYIVATYAKMAFKMIACMRRNPGTVPWGLETRTAIWKARYPHEARWRIVNGSWQRGGTGPTLRSLPCFYVLNQNQSSENLGVGKLWSVMCLESFAVLSLAYCQNHVVHGRIITMDIPVMTYLILVDSTHSFSVDIGSFATLLMQVTVPSNFRTKTKGGFENPLSEAFSMRRRSYEVVQKAQEQPEGMNTGMHPYATCQFESGEITDVSTVAELWHPEPSSLMGFRSIDMPVYQMSFVCVFQGTISEATSPRETDLLLHHSINAFGTR